MITLEETEYTTCLYLNSGVKNMYFFHVRNIEGQNSSEHTVYCFAIFNQMPEFFLYSESNSSQYNIMCRKPAFLVDKNFLPRKHSHRRPNFAQDGRG